MGNTSRQNITMGIVAHVDAGKTTLSEGILYLTGRIRTMGRVDDQDAYLDNYDLERARGITIFAKQAVFSLGQRQVTLLDTPGHVDFSAEMERTLQVLDCAVLVVSGADGVQGHTETLWRLLKRHSIPTLLFINKMDQPDTDRHRLLAELKDRLDEACVDLEAPEADEELAMCDEGLLEKYLDRGSLEEEDRRELISRRRVFPCFFGSALRAEGIQELLDAIDRYIRTPDRGKTPSGRIFKISRDDQGNRLTHVKVTGGSLKVKETLPGLPDEKINQIRIYSGARYELVQAAEAGMVCALTGPSGTYPGQVLGEEKEAPRPVLEPVLTYRILLPEGIDIPGTLRKLAQLEEEDPQLHLVWREELGELQAQVMGDVQIEILKSLIQERFSLEVEFDRGSIVYKETITRPVEGVGHFEPLRHYAEVHLIMEPAEPGRGMELEADCSEDLLERNWQRLVLTHLEEKSHRGVLTGACLTDVRIRLTAGKAHLKHTEGGDFRQSTYRAVRQGLMEARSAGACLLLEPWYAFRLEVPAENLGRAMNDIQQMKGSFEPPVSKGDMSLLTGSAPAVTMRNYQREVISYTRGRGRLALDLEGYKPCHNQEEVVAAAAYDPEADPDNPSGSVFCSHGAGYNVPWDQVKDHMHLEATLKEPEAEDSQEPLLVKMPQARAAAVSGSTWGDDKELEEIFKRTFGDKKKDKDKGKVGSSLFSPAPRAALRPSGKPETAREPQEEYLLVDGYNIIFAWEELRELSKLTIDGARYKLMDLLCNYQGFRRCHLIVVFDAYKVAGNTGQALKYHNIHVVYTKEAETADQYIEKLAHQMGRSHRVTVATSDGLEQLIIYGQGCLLMSASDLKEDMERVRREVKEEQERLKKPGKNYLFQGVDEELRAYLDQVRLGSTVLQRE